MFNINSIILGKVLKTIGSPVADIENNGTKHQKLAQVPKEAIWQELDIEIPPIII